MQSKHIQDHSHLAQSQFDFEQNLGKVLMINHTSTKSEIGGYFCESCDFHCNDSLTYLNHLTSWDHIRVMGLNPASTLGKRQKFSPTEIHEKIENAAKVKAKMKEWKQKRIRERRKIVKGILMTSEDHVQVPPPPWELTPAMRFSLKRVNLHPEYVYAATPDFLLSLGVAVPNEEMENLVTKQTALKDSILSQTRELDSVRSKRVRGYEEEGSSFGNSDSLKNKNNPNLPTQGKKKKRLKK